MIELVSHKQHWILAVLAVLLSCSVSCTDDPTGAELPETTRLNGIWAESFDESYRTGTLTHVSTLTLTDSVIEIEISPSLYRVDITPERLDLHTTPITYSDNYSNNNDSLYIHLESEVESYRIEVVGDTLRLFRGDAVVFDDGSEGLPGGSILWDYSLIKSHGSFIRVTE